MRVIAARSRGWARRMGMAVINEWANGADGNNSCLVTALSGPPCKRDGAPASRRGAALLNRRYARSATVAEEAQQEQEQVDEVEVERERAHHSLAADDGAVLHRVIHLFDALGVPGGQARKDQPPRRGDYEVEP